MVGFHRRFDPEFLRAKKVRSSLNCVIRNEGGPRGSHSAILLISVFHLLSIKTHSDFVNRSCDPCEPTTRGLDFVLSNSVCHEVEKYQEVVDVLV